jgi:hypothetical protein
VGREARKEKVMEKSWVWRKKRMKVEEMRKRRQKRKRWGKGVRK